MQAVHADTENRIIDAMISATFRARRP